MSSIIFDPKSGYALSIEHQRIAEVIHDYDPALSLVWIPPSERSLNELHPFAVVHSPSDAPPYIVMRLKESEVDHRVLARLWGADAKNGNVLDKIEAEDAARKALELKRQEDEIEEAREKAAWMIKAPVGAKIDGMRLT